MTSCDSRRSFLKSSVAFAACAYAERTNAEGTFPFSSGSQPPKLRAPAGACDCHIHIFDKRFPASPHWKGQPVEDATVDAYRRIQKRIGTNRVVVVTPSTYGVDNRATLDGLAQFGEAARGVAVIDLDLADSALKSMADQRVTGVRVNFVTPQSWGLTTPERLETTAKRVAAYGWHVQIYATADQIVELEPVLSRLPTPLVIDHLGRLPPEGSTSHPGFAVIKRLLDRGRTWVKLSGAYLNTKIGAPTYADATQMAQAYAQIAPERIVWGSDWNHRGEKHMPDDAVLFDLLLEWVPHDASRHRVLVDNPAALYGFPRAI